MWGWVLALVWMLAVRAGTSRPHIVIIIADDLGFNDVGFHGSNQIPTPNIDALAYSGRILQRYYVTPICTPSRAALMTGKYPIHNGMQHGVLYGAEPSGLPLTEKILPQYLKELGYKTHLVGKWHLGSYKKEYLPLNRGFDTHLGFWAGRIDMYDHTSMEQGSWGTDFRRDFSIAHDLFGQYATDIFTNESVKIIKAHNKTSPMFLTLAHSAVHSGNPYEPIRAPDALINNFTHIINVQRRKFAAVLTKLDESVGRVVQALQSRDMLYNSIILFTTDNGGPAAGFNENAASNYPLRGVKNTLWEGGVRGAGAVWAEQLAAPASRPAPQIHLTDWLPTLYAAAGGDSSKLEGLDGFNQWDALIGNSEFPRNVTLHNIDDVEGIAAITVDKWKLLKGTTYRGVWDYWYGPSGREGAYDVDLVRNSLAGNAFHTSKQLPINEKIIKIRNSATVNCTSTYTTTPCKPLQSPCLFNIEEDPCERNNLAVEYPEILRWLTAELTKLNKTAVPHLSKPIDPRGDPKFWDRVYTNFADYLIVSNETRPDCNDVCLRNDIQPKR